jgi:hypothetical protein
MRASTTILPPSEANGLTTNIVSLAFSTADVADQNDLLAVGFRLDCMHILAVAPTGLHTRNNAEQ